VDEILSVSDASWDLEEEVKTLKHAAETWPGRPVPKAVRPAGSSPPTPDPSSGPAQSAELLELLAARLAAVEASADGVGIARARVELAVVCEALLAEIGHAAAHARAALVAAPGLPAAHALLRRIGHPRTAYGPMLEHLEEELRGATVELAIPELLAEKARLLEASGAGAEAVSAAWERVLVHAPEHPAALKGLEAELIARVDHGEAGARDLLAAHWTRMADAYAAHPPTAAWIHVERAWHLEADPTRRDAARAALERAVSLDASIGPVRGAIVRHVSTHRDWPSLARLLDQEAAIEPSNERAARLELDAASIAWTRIGDRAWATRLLERAAARAPTTRLVDRRVLDDLIRAYEAAGRSADAIRAREARLPFFTDPAPLAHELSALGALHERLGDLRAAADCVQRAIAHAPGDPTRVETLDRLLAELGDHEARVEAWTAEAARSPRADERVRALCRAAQIAERTLKDPSEALRHLRAAWVSAPGDLEALDGLVRLITPALPDAAIANVRALVELHTQAAEHAPDAGRRIASLERAALLCEELLADPAQAGRLYQDILGLDPNRRVAVVGLTRTAARLGDDRTLARALLDEARLCDSEDARFALEVRAATALARIDPARALPIVEEVVRRRPSHPEARALQTRLHEEAGRWALVAGSLRARIESAESREEKARLWLLFAHLQDVRLRAPGEAVDALRAAHALVPTHPVPPEEMARLLEAQGDARTLRDTLESLAQTAPSPEERARYLVRAAEVDELALEDDASAVRLYGLALEQVPGEELVADRYARALERLSLRAPSPELTERRSMELTRRIAQAKAPEASQSFTFELACLRANADPRGAMALLDSLGEPPWQVPALRVFERIARRSGDRTALASALTRQGDALGDVRAQLGALSNLATLEEWRLPATLRRILSLDPNDVAALEAVVRRESPSAREGDERALDAVLAALRALVPLAPDDGTRLALQLRLGLMLERWFDAHPDAVDVGREALDRYGDALRSDPLCVVAATGLSRLARRLGDPALGLDATRALSRLATDPKLRARHLAEAADLLLGPGGDERIGSPLERRQRAAALLEEALEGDPDSAPAAERLAAVLREGRQGERLATVLRAALSRAKTAEGVIALGTELARVARDDLEDLTLAIDAIRRVRAAAPDHMPSLLTLAELCIAQRAWPEAVEALEQVAVAGREPGPRLTALFALASVYERVLGRPAEVERVVRMALEVDPSNLRALRLRLRHLGGAAKASPEHAPEVMSLLARLAEAETEAGAKVEALLDLAELSVRVGQGQVAEQALVEAAAQAPSDGRAFERLAALYPASEEGVVARARALAMLLGRGQQLGKIEPRWLEALGRLEVEALGRLRDGVAHLRQAVQLDPHLYDARTMLALASARLGAHEDAIRLVASMVAPDPKPLLATGNPGGALEVLESSLNATRRPEEALIATELRALVGGLDEGRYTWLRARRLPARASGHTVLDRPTLVTHVLPSEARHILLEVAAAVAGLEARVFRADLTELGVTPRDRISPRSGHPTRALLDRVAAQLGLTDVELVISPTASHTRVIAQDNPWVVIPATLTELPEPVQLASIARALARVAFGVPWLDELPPEHVSAFLVACARQAVPAYATESLDATAEALVAHYEKDVARAVSRRQRKLLEELAAHIDAPQGRPIPADIFVPALRRAECRAAYLLGGDLLALVDELGICDASLRHAIERGGRIPVVAVLEHLLAGDVVRFALTPDAVALRRHLGTVWTS
jgi:tetratricopeptide (TPR) repeat protein